MSSIEGIAVAPTSKKIIEKSAIQYLINHCPESLEQPGPIDIERILDVLLFESHGFSTKIVQSFLDPTVEAQTNLLERTIEIKESCYNELHQAKRGRFTAGHEAGHVILHSSQLYSSLIIHKRILPCIGELPTYRNPEWQADHFSGALLMPLLTVLDFIEELKKRGFNDYNIIKEVSEKYLVSYKAAQTRIKQISQPELAGLAYSYQRVKNRRIPMR